MSENTKPLNRFLAALPAKEYNRARLPRHRARMTCRAAALANRARFTFIPAIMMPTHFRLTHINERRTVDDARQNQIPRNVMRKHVLSPHTFIKLLGCG